MIIYMTQLAVGHDRTKRDLPVVATYFCGVMFIDMAGKQSITAQPTAMLTAETKIVLNNLEYNMAYIWEDI